MITIVVASFGVLSPRCVIVPRQSKQVTSSTRQHQKLRFPSAMAASPNGKSDTSNTWLDVTEVLRIYCLWIWTPHQSEKRQAIDCLVCPCCVFCTVSKPIGSTSLHLSRCKADHLLPHYVEAKNAKRFASMSLWPCTFSCRGVYVYCKWNIHCAYKRTRGLDVFAIVKKMIVFVISVRPSVSMKQLHSFWKN